MISINIQIYEVVVDWPITLFLPFGGQFVMKINEFNPIYEKSVANWEKISAKLRFKGRQKAESPFFMWNIAIQLLDECID